jgi:hypothetical protein
MVQGNAAERMPGKPRRSGRITEFRVLGPVEVVIDGRPVSILASRQEIVLTLLVLDVNHVVSAVRMIDALWGDNPPRTAKTQVHITISALRRLLGDDVISSRPPGYLIKAAKEAVDLTRFESLVAQAAGAAAAHRLFEAVELLRAALALWRGEPMEGVDSKVVQAAAIGLRSGEYRCCRIAWISNSSLVCIMSSSANWLQSRPSIR